MQDDTEANTGPRWLGPDANPWGVPVLDVRPITLTMLSTSRDPQCAANAISFGQDDGLGFVGEGPWDASVVPIALRFPVGRTLADGALFVPDQMEHKWALFFHGAKILCVRSWTRVVQVVADVRQDGDCVEVTGLRGAFVDENEESSYGARVLDYLLRSHALDEVYPVPLPAGLEAEPMSAALWCMAMFGNHAHFATPHEVKRIAPGRPLRTHSLLHIAVARGHADDALQQLERGVPIDLLARDGLAPLHWAVSSQDTAIMEFLLRHGSPVDVRSDEGATPLMNAVQAGSLDKVAFLLDHGADPDAGDARGFTGLHRAAEMGRLEIVRLLLDRGAAPAPEAHGHTPRALAEQRGELAIVALLDGRSHGRL